MKSNNIKYQVRQLTYKNDILVEDYIWNGPFDNIYEVEVFISICKLLDRNQPERKCIYIIEVLQLTKEHKSAQEKSRG